MANHIYYNNYNSNTIHVDDIQQILITNSSVTNGDVRIEILDEPEIDDDYVIFNLKVTLLTYSPRSQINYKGGRCAIGLYRRAVGKRYFGGYSHTGSGSSHGSGRYPKKKLGKYHKYRFEKMGNRVYDTEVRFINTSQPLTITLYVPLSKLGCDDDEDIRYENFRIN